MAQVIYEFPTADGIVLVEAEGPKAVGPTAVSRGGRVVAKATESFEAALAGIRPIAEGIVAQTASLATAPKEVKACFGIKLSGEMGALLASTAAEAHIEITLTWEREGNS